MGQMAYAYDDENMEMIEEEEEVKVHSKKKKSSKKMKETSENSNGKLKQTRLIFTPKDNLAGKKRPYQTGGDSSNDFNNEEGEN
jgi:hypothetical protein